MKNTLLALLLLVPLSSFAQKVMELKPEGAPATFVEQMQQSTDPALMDLMLESYLNSLLKANAIGRKKGKDEISYVIRANRAGELVVTRSQQADKGVVKNNHSLKVYGVGYALKSDCSRVEQRCWVLYPNRDERWLEIDYAPKAAKELAKGMGLLIKELQR